MSEIQDTVQAFSHRHPRTQYDDEYVVCPYCGSRSGDCCEWVSETVRSMNCDDCGGLFDYWAEYSVTYVAQPVKEEAENGDAQDPD